MKINIFAIADYADIQSEKMTIVGVFDNWLSSTFPFSPAPFGIVLKGYAEAHDYGKEKEVVFKIRPKRNKKTIFECKGKIAYPEKGINQINAIALRFMVAGMLIEKPGSYLCECEIDNEVLSSFEMEAKNTKTPASPKKKTKKKKVKKK